LEFQIANIICKPLPAVSCRPLSAFANLSFGDFYYPTFAYFADRCRCMLGAFARLATLKLPAFANLSIQPFSAFTGIF
jgi:hypothetical protein